MKNIFSIKTVSWDEIEKYFLELNNLGWEHNKLLELVVHIKNSSIAKRIYGFTSLDKLVITIYEEPEWNRESLIINFNRIEQKWEFTYYSLPNGKPEFVRQYNSEIGIEKFDSFIEMIKW